MKKSLLALAVLGTMAGVASAQTSITIYGTIDAGVRHQTNVGPSAGSPGNDSKWTMSSGGTYNQNRLGFKGVEDLGNGMNAHFNLEMGWNSGTGAGDADGLFQRTASVGLGGAWGSVDLGRQYSVNFQTIGAYDPFIYKYTGIVPLAGQGGLTRLNNDLKYTGTFGGVTVRAEYAFGEVAGSTSTGATQAIGASYAAGPFSVGGAYTQGKRNAFGLASSASGTAFATGVGAQLTAAGIPAANVTALLGAAAPATNDMKNWTVGGAYMTGPFRIAAGYADFKSDVPAALAAVAGADRIHTKNWWLGGHMYVTPAAAITVGYYETKGFQLGANNALSNDAKRKLFIVGGTYALSKRTNFYADIDSARFSAPATNNVTQTGFSVGINHLF